MPTIGKATIDVDYDGDDLPRQARQIGEKAGSAQSEAMGRELEKGAKETNADLGKEAERAGKDHGKKYGVNYADSLDKVLKRDLQRTSDRVADVFKDDGSLKKHLEGMKDVGREYETLSGDLDRLHEKHVLTDDDYRSLRGRLDSFTAGLENERRATRDAADQVDASRASYERMRAERSRLANDRLSSFWEEQQEAARRFSASLERDVTPKIRSAADDIEHLGEKVEVSGRTVDRRSGTFRRLFRSFEGGVGRTIDGIGDSLIALGGAADGAGNKAGGATPKFGKLFHAFSNFDPADNIGQLILLIIAFAPQVAVLAEAAGAGLLILAGGAAAFAAAGVGFGVAFSNLFGDLKKVDPAVRPAAKALQDFVKKDLASLRSDLQKQIFTPAVTQQFQQFATGLTVTLKTAFAQIGPALNQVLLGVSKDLNSSGFKEDLKNLFSGMAPVIKDLGGIIRNAFGIIGQLITQSLPYVKDFTGEVEVATGKFLSFLKSPEGKNAIKKFFEDTTPVLKAVGDAIVDISKAILDLATPQNIKNTTKLLQDLADAAPGLANFADKINDVVSQIGAVIDALSQVASGIGDFFDGLFSAGDKFAISAANLFSGIALSVDNMVQGIGENIASVGKAIGQAARGDFVGAAQTISQAMENTKKRVGTAMDGLGVIIGDGAAKFRSLDGDAQLNLSNLAKRFDIPQSRAQEFGGKIASLAEAAGIDIGSISKSKGWDDLQAKTGAASGTIQDLQRDFGKLPKDVKTKVSQEGAEAAKKKVGDFKAGIDALTNKQVVVKEDGADASKKRVQDFKTKVDALVSKTIGVKEEGASASDGRVAALKGKIAALVGKLVKVEESGAAPSDKRVQDLKGRISALVGKVVKVQEEGAAASKGRVDGLISSITNLKGKTINISEVTTRYSKAGGTLGATGGMMIGGQLQQIGTKHFRAFAKGGITAGTQYRGNAIIGEAGPEAIVPLSGALGNVDKSVRALAAFARGRTVAGAQGQAPGKQVNVAEGAIVVNTRVNDPRQVGSQVLDRLAIAVGVG